MRSFTFFTILAAGLSSFAAIAAAADTKKAVDYPPVSDNAALQYWQAFAMMSPLDAKQEKLLENWDEVPLDDSTNKLLDQTHASLMFLGRGAKRQNCDWGVDYHDGVSMLLPHLGKARALARLAALDGRVAFESKQGDRARDDAFGMVALARHAGKDHTLVSALVCYAIEGTAIDMVAPYLPEVSASYEEGLAALKELPPRPRLDEAMRSEKFFARSIITQLEDAEKHQPGSWRRTWRAIIGNDNQDPLNDAENLGQAVAATEKFMPVYDEMAQLLVLPPKDFDTKYPEFVKRTETTHPMSKFLFPSIQNVVAANRRSEARMAMLLAAIAVIETGPEKLADIKDPFGDGPFTYKKLDKGFELSSKLEKDGKPITLAVGVKKKVSAK